MPEMFSHKNIRNIINRHINQVDKLSVTAWLIKSGELILKKILNQSKFI